MRRCYRGSQYHNYNSDNRKRGIRTRTSPKTITNNKNKNTANAEFSKEERRTTPRSWSGVDPVLGHSQLAMANQKYESHKMGNEQEYIRMNGCSAPSKTFSFLHIVNPSHRLVWPQREIQRFDWVCLDQTFGSLFETCPLWFASPSVVPSAPACRLIKSLITSALITAYYHQPNWLSY